MKVILVGYMGSGKTTTGKKLSRMLDYDFVDTDQAFEEKYKISVFNFFKKYDEKLFRKLEHEVLKEVLMSDNVLISTGGGTPCYYNNMELINASGTSVYLKLSAKSLYYRLKDSKKLRPLFHGKEIDDPVEYITKQLEYREQYYMKADQIVKGEDLDIKQLHQSLIKLSSNK